MIKINSKSGYQMKVDRLVSIIMILLDKERIGAQELADMFEVSFLFMENEYYYDMLLSFGNKCECLEPLHIRSEMKRRIYDIALLYKN